MAKKPKNVKHSTKWYRLVRPDHLKGKEHDAEWKAYKTMHGGTKGALGNYIFGKPRGTGALQKAVNNPKMHVDGDYHNINWDANKKLGGKVRTQIKKIRGPGDFGIEEARKHRAEIYKKTGKLMKPSEARKHLMQQHYMVTYGPDGRAK